MILIDQVVFGCYWKTKFQRTIHRWLYLFIHRWHFQPLEVQNKSWPKYQSYKACKHYMEFVMKVLWYRCYNEWYYIKTRKLLSYIILKHRKLLPTSEVCTGNSTKLQDNIYSTGMHYCNLSAESNIRTSLWHLKSNKTAVIKVRNQER